MTDTTTEYSVTYEGPERSLFLQSGQSKRRLFKGEKTPVPAGIAKVANARDDCKVDTVEKASGGSGS